MSQSVPAKANRQTSQKNLHPVAVAHKSGMNVAVVRDVKDLNENTHLHLRRKKQQMLFAVSLFLLIGLLILTGQVISKPRMVAGSSVGMEASENPTPIDHDGQNCYEGKNGEQVCKTGPRRQ